MGDNLGPHKMPKIYIPENSFLRKRPRRERKWLKFQKTQDYLPGERQGLWKRFRTPDLNTCCPIPPAVTASKASVMFRFSPPTRSPRGPGTLSHLGEPQNWIGKHWGQSESNEKRQNNFPGWRTAAVTVAKQLWELPNFPHLEPGERSSCTTSKCRNTSQRRGYLKQGELAAESPPTSSRVLAISNCNSTNTERRKTTSQSCWEPTDDKHLGPQPMTTWPRTSQLISQSFYSLICKKTILYVYLRVYVYSIHYTCVYLNTAYVYVHMYTVNTIYEIYPINPNYISTSTCLDP